MEQVKYLLNHENISLTAIDDSIKVTNPATKEILAYVKKTDEASIADIIQNANLAFKSWSSALASFRSDILMKWYELVMQNRANLARLMTLEQGKSFNEASGEIAYAASFIKWFAAQALRNDGDILTSVKKDEKLLVIKQPIGVCAAITPWNFPSAMITRKAAPALGAGCSMIVKPASQTPLSAYALASLAYTAGIPKDLFVIVSGDADMMSTAFANSKIIRKISFTGSTEVGIKIYEKSAKTIKKLSLELGGNAPFIVFNDANLDKAVDGVMASKFRNSGQTCVCANRIYAQSGIYDEFCAKLNIAIKSLKLGNGLENGVNQGPLIDENALKKVEEHINDALKKGAKCLSGGKRSSLGGTFFEPTLLSGATKDMLVAREETFGPLCPVFKFQSDEEAIEAANDTDFGLASYIFTNDPKRQWNMSESLEYGMVGVNTGLISNEVAPFGGVKFSGLGREGSRYGMDEYTEQKYICLNL
ncbi:NAD-dependent succinate-semialdehyde dehydrogenase [Campylobacter fetus]|uniref:NAD-dependent succinate-semialdehyde dehydrogenase n=1 Tax=Campylobacter fetus TaxID=196 RepID=A0A5L8U8K5_CAMFE|nr:NAD-dependent succinate-semialdehyde dehydrogenase [Campylobacter fetus]EAI5407323.1 NAD-dependent succinate-semialdehyde dehydrogenase [Campylobacter fetus]EAJ0327855.1 NAD-dependent succinate-semialdehyde dehydrogenase [Campylobacter fetus]EAJ1229745.1 NAD-dependent succinate-semialdehyde dehydrogenase [Campylobacter fetus]EAK0434343.1 NAD-dependent succinate-semialdehyde dehydrogenase [Campylobacter fetus]EAK0468110.1 NAD-dependent succinate-semialdehyde dehydrogenase [Campylobacter fetu